MERTPDHLQPTHFYPHPLLQSDAATLWFIDTTHPHVVSDDHVSARLATTMIWSLDKDRTYALLVLRDTYMWSDEAVPELLRYVATHLHGPETDVTDTFSIDVFTAKAVSSPAGRKFGGARTTLTRHPSRRRRTVRTMYTEELRRWLEKDGYEPHTRSVRYCAFVGRH